MDFIPRGFITIPNAVDRILRMRHGEDWGTQEIHLEPDEIDIPGTQTDDGTHLRGQPYDRKAIDLGRQQTREAQAELRAALQNGALTAEVDGGPLVPTIFWDTNGAGTTIQTGALELGAAAKHEDRKWQHCRVLLKTDEFDAWLQSSSPAESNVKRGRHTDSAAEALLVNNIRSVLLAAERLWGVPEVRPGRNQMARELSLDEAVRKTGYKAETIRKILNGSYPPSRRRDIKGLPGIDPRVS